MTFYICAVALPFIAALQRFAVAYGYQGESKAIALRSARQVFSVMAFIMTIAVLGYSQFQTAQ